jgi:RHS repeat-associated protein
MRFRPGVKLVSGGLAALLSASAPLARAVEVEKFYHLDAVGSVRAITDTNGSVLERFDYHPYGEDVAPPSTSNTRRFTSKERDPETAALGGLDYFGARYYFGRVARFTSVDPVYNWNENLSDPQRWNKYAYARNNPLRYVDPDGRSSEAILEFQRDTLQFYEQAPPNVKPLVFVGVALAAAAVVLSDAETYNAVQKSAIETFGAMGASGAGMGPDPIPYPRNWATSDLYSKNNEGTVNTGTRPGDLPAKGEPNSSAAKDYGGGRGQIRDYGPDGRAKTDYDFGHDHGSGDPHAHDWDWTKKRPRQPGRPLEEPSPQPEPSPQ